ncbi:MAG: 50S ribosomal protein L21 [Bacillota bacterium]|nr:50S ribosomal protein L21 [Bacillota bacterium]
MYAVIRTGGKQYKVAVGDEIYVEKLEGEVGDEICFDEVLAVSDEDGLRLQDQLEGVTVTGEVVKQGRGKKIIVFKMKKRKGYRRTQGHRQPYTRVAIRSIG